MSVIDEALLSIFRGGTPGDANMLDVRKVALGREHSPRQNLLLASLSEPLQERLFPQLELVYLPFGRMLFESGAKVRHVYFPTDSLVALLCLLENGGADEISVTGNEGMVGVSSFMGGDSSLGRAVVQCPGFAYRLSRNRLLDEFDRHGELLRVLLRYVGSLVVQVGQTAVCNRHHSVEQQLCRWLLLCLDRVPDAPLAMTHGAMAEMLGVRRESVSSAAASLRERGFIEYHRGHVTVLDRGKLEELACECYQVIRAAAIHPPHECADSLDFHRRQAPYMPGVHRPASLQAERPPAVQDA